MQNIPSESEKEIRCEKVNASNYCTNTSLKWTKIPARSKQTHHKEKYPEMKKKIAIKFKMKKKKENKI